jgi:molybdopterin-biosynthesis enzyme MoeA-like protein
VIGGKILSGRTKDQNICYIAEYLTALGIDLKEVRGCVYRKLRLARIGDAVRRGAPVT